MDNNQRRRPERRRRARRVRAVRGACRAEPLSVPPPAGTRCAVCAVRPATLIGELAVTGHAETFRFPMCAPCRDAAPGVIQRIGFVGYCRLFERNMRNAADAGP